MGERAEATVYFLRPIGMDGPVKIGSSVNPHGRLNTYSLMSPFPLEIAATIAGGDVMERRFHALFAESHSHHEWFKPSAVLTATIERIVAGTFDVSTLPAPKHVTRVYVWTEERREKFRALWAGRRAERNAGPAPPGLGT